MNAQPAEAMSELTKVVYIGGYGHSGSTLLEYLMSESPTVMACGEVKSCIREGPRRRGRCSCGRKANECPVWAFFYSPTNYNARWTHAGLLHALTHRFGGHYSAIVELLKNGVGIFKHALSSPAQVRP